MDCRYITSALDPQQLPEFTQPEIAFIGRSNTGKSSLINSVLGRRNLARHGRTPGQTQMINFFGVGLEDKLIIADLPGYGFSAIEKNRAQKWQPLIESYMRRPNIQEFLFLIDCRRDLNDDDWVLLYALGRNLPVYVVLTKSDKISKRDLQLRIRKTSDEISAKGIELKKVHPVSNLKQDGVLELRQDLLALIQPSI
jgi:GTP-binding protein